MKKDFLVLAVAFFATYPTENEIFFTSDKQAFFNENDAINHAKSLRAKENDEPVVINITREEADAEKVEEDPNATAGEKKDAEIKAAEKNVEKAKAAFDKATEAYNGAAAQLKDSPENKNFIKWEASGKQKLEAAQKAVEDALAELAKWQAA